MIGVNQFSYKITVNQALKILVSKQTGTDTDIEFQIHFSVTMSASVANKTEELFSSSLLDDLDLESCQATFKPQLSARYSQS